ncbi:uncharacterized protein LOC127753868 [Oryza glaberrima]|uniref:uncharacterized protein LOC127753868 n=1 Tax=Oryza glaberrima TaxID=4538 RepID=UPI00023DFC45|nr:uncharacterized protein LOC127753868 [Oryza glaberrima]
MAGLFASSAVKWAIDNLSSLLPAAAAAGSSRGLDALEELRTLERTMRRIHATLRDAEQRWNIRGESAAKLRLEELKELAYDAEDVVEEYEYEVNRRKVEALDRLAAVHGGGGKRKREEISVPLKQMAPQPTYQTCALNYLGSKEDPALSENPNQPVSQAANQVAKTDNTVSELNNEVATRNQHSSMDIYQILANQT